MQPDPATLLLQREGAVLHVRLNRPEVRNAMSLAMVRQLTDALRQAEQDGARLITLRGAGGHFSAGADLKDMAAARTAPSSGAADPLAEANAAFGRMCAAFSAANIVTVAVLEGAVMGGGFGLACAVDVAIASSTADFRLPETSLGIVPAQIAPFLVERVGYSEAKRLSVTGAQFGAREAFRIGLVHKICDGEEALTQALNAEIERILACAPNAIAETKKLLRKARFAPPGSLVEEAASVFARAARSEEGAEGLRAFAEKRKPDWAPQ